MEKMSTPTTKDRQRWQPEEDAILCAYVKQYGPHDWHLVSERMGQALDRDPKSCHERWRNYLKPGIKKGPLTEEEQQLVIKLQTKYGNKWKRIAAEVPGRTAKRLGKWWEVYKERKLKENKRYLDASGIISSSPNAESMIHHPLPALVPTFSRPFLSISPDLCHHNSGAAAPVPAFSTSTSENGICRLSSPLHQQHQVPNNVSVVTTETGDETLLTLGPSSAKSCHVPEKREVVATSIPKWLPRDLEVKIASTLSESGLSLSSVEPTTESSGNNSAEAAADSNMLIDLFKELKESRDNWMVQKKKIAAKLRELKKQLEMERIEKQRQKMEEVEAKVQALKKEQELYIQKLEQDYGELVLNLERDAEAKENKLMEAWTSKYEKLAHMFDQQCSSIHGPLFQAIHSGGIDNVA